MMVIGREPLWKALAISLHAVSLLMFRHVRTVVPRTAPEGPLERGSATKAEPTSRRRGRLRPGRESELFGQPDALQLARRALGNFGQHHEFCAAP